MSHLLSDPVQVYYNLHRHCWSIRDKKTRRVILHADEVILKDCVFKVSEAGRQRVLKEKRKNVHAWVEGTIISVSIDYPNSLEFKDRESWGKTPLERRGKRTQVRYNPYKYPKFYHNDIEDVDEAKYAYMRYNRTVEAYL